MKNRNEDNMPYFINQAFCKVFVDYILHGDKNIYRYFYLYFVKNYALDIRKFQKNTR